VARKNNKKALNPAAYQALNRFKMEIAGELGLMPQGGDGSSFEATLEKYKEEIASELGLSQQIREQGWKSLPSRDCGSVGGRMGGKIGGQMVKKLVALAEEDLKNQ
jgi:hypothetical protein